VHVLQVFGPASQHVAFTPIGNLGILHVCVLREDMRMSMCAMFAWNCVYMYKIARTFIHTISPLRNPPYPARACTHTQTHCLVRPAPHACTHTHRGPGAGYCNAVTRKTGQKYLRIFRRCSSALRHRTLRDSRGRARHRLAAGAAVSRHTGLFPSPQPTSPTDLKFPADEPEGGRAMGCCVQQQQ
jgi:hypothetical protein